MHLPHYLLSACLLAGLIWAAPLAHSQSDDFSDGDDVGWERYDPFEQAGLGARVTFDPSGGSYRIASLPSPAPGQVGPARAGAFRPEIYTDFCVSVDVPIYDGSLEQAFGILARVQPGYGLGNVDGYAMTYHPIDNDIQISRVVDEQPQLFEPFVTLSEPPASGVLRLVFFGIGDLLVGRAYDAGNPLSPLAEAVVRDNTYAMGINGVTIFDNTDTADEAADATFDNYVATNCNPPALQLNLEGGDELTISWKMPFDWYDVRQSLDLQSWGDVPAGGGSVFYRDGVFSFDTVVPGGAPTRCFRLRRHSLPEPPVPG